MATIQPTKRRKLNTGPPLNKWELEDLKQGLLLSPTKTEKIRDWLLKKSLEGMGHWGEYSYLGHQSTKEMCLRFDGDSAFLVEEGKGDRPEAKTFKELAQHARNLAYHQHGLSAWVYSTIEKELRKPGEMEIKATEEVERGFFEG